MSRDVATEPVTNGESPVYDPFTPVIPMTQRSSTTNASDPREPSEKTLGLVTSLRPQSLVTPVRVVCFWAAVLLPLFYLPLVLTGMETIPEAAAFLVLLVLNVAALVGGHRYND